MGEQLKPERKRPPGLRFSLATLFVVTIVLAVGFGALGGMLQGGTDRRMFIVIAAAAPTAAIAVIGVAVFLTRWWRGRR